MSDPQVDWDETDGDEEGYYSELDADDVEFTGKEPKFVLVPSSKLSANELNECKIDELIKYYRLARDQLATDRKGYKAREAKIKLHLSTISAILRNRADLAGGVDSFATPEGTAFRKVKEFYRVGDWDGLAAYVLETGNIHLLHKRVSTIAAREIKQATGSLPPGVEFTEEVDFVVRAPTAGKRKR